MEEGKRIVWVDWLKVTACFMVMVVHSSEPFYLGGNGALIENGSDALWLAFFDSLARSCVPLFVIASSFLLFPLNYSAGTFFRKRVIRILIPFALWSLFYAFYWGDPVTNLKGLLLNFNYAAGHLWFIYMLSGLYLIMPLLSPWARSVGKKELSVYIAIWFLSTLIPLIRDWVATEPIAVIYGPTGIPRQALYPLFGEACWNNYSAFYYISGFVGYLLVGLWLRKFGADISRKKALLTAIPCFIGGFLISFGGFVRRVFATSGGNFPVGKSFVDSVWWETTWGFDSTGVALMAIGVVLLMMRVTSCGKFYRCAILPMSKASYGMYLGHMVALAFYAELFRGIIPSTPLVILATAVASFLTVAVASVGLRKIPVIGKLIV